MRCAHKNVDGILIAGGTICTLSKPRLGRVGAYASCATRRAKGPPYFFLNLVLHDMLIHVCPYEYIYRARGG